MWKGDDANGDDLTFDVSFRREGDVLYSGLSLTHANAQLLTLGAALACRRLPRWPWCGPMRAPPRWRLPFCTKPPRWRATWTV